MRCNSTHKSVSALQHPPLIPQEKKRKSLSTPFLQNKTLVAHGQKKNLLAHSQILGPNFEVGFTRTTNVS